MRTQLIIACTNRNPDEIGEMGETYRALLERFVLRQYVAWEHYDMAAYETLIDKHPVRFTCGSTKTLFCKLIEDCHNAGHFVSPRTAMKAATILEGTARARGATTVNVHDFLALKHVAGFSYTMNTFVSNMEAKLKEAQAEKELTAQLTRMQQYKDEYTTFTQDATASTKVIEWAIWSARFTKLADFVNKLAVPDSLFERRGEAVREFTDLASTCATTAIAQVRIPDFIVSEK